MASMRPSPPRDIQFLGWFSLGLGLTQILAPQRLNRFIGAPENRNRALMRTLGLRELATGVAILTRQDPSPWIKARVGGDLMDLALLGAAMRAEGAERGRLLGATAAVLGVTALDLACSARLGATSERQAGAVHVSKAITIHRPIEEVFAFWRDLTNLPRFMAHLEEVRVLGGGRSYWRATAPAGMHVEWEAELIEDRPGSSIGWCTLPGADVAHWGRVIFREAPRGRGTEVHVELHYDPPAGSLGYVMAKLLGEEPSQQVGDDLHRLKQVLEVGEVVRSDAAPEGRMRPLLRQFAAQPMGVDAAAFDEHVRVALEQVPEAGMHVEIAHHAPVEGEEGGGADEPADERVVVPDDGVLHRVREHQEDDQVERVQLRELPLAREAEPDDEEAVDQDRAEHLLEHRERESEEMGPERHVHRGIVRAVLRAC